MNTRWKGISCSHLYVRQTGCYLKDWMNTSGLWLAEHCATFSCTAACAVVLTFENSGSSIKTQEWKCVLWLRCVNSNTNCSVPGFISINNWHVWIAIFKVNACVHSWQVGAAFAGACADSFGSFFRATFQKILNFFCCPFHRLCSWFLRLLFTVMNATYMCQSSNHVLAAEPESTS